MVKLILCGLSRTVLFVKDPTYMGLMNDLHNSKKEEPSYVFWDYFRLDEELLEFLKALKGDYMLVLFTAGKIQNYAPLNEKLEPVFDEMLDPEILGFPKSDFNAYKVIAERYKIQSNEILFLDDDITFQKAAAEVGCNTSSSENGVNYNVIKGFLGIPT